MASYLISYWYHITHWVMWPGHLKIIILAISWLALSRADLLAEEFAQKRAGFVVHIIKSNPGLSSAMGIKDLLELVADHEAWHATFFLALTEGQEQFHIGPISWNGRTQFVAAVIPEREWPLSALTPKRKLLMCLAPSVTVGALGAEGDLAQARFLARLIAWREWSTSENVADDAIRQITEKADGLRRLQLMIRTAYLEGGCRRLSWGEIQELYRASGSPTIDIE